ncbi:MAG: SufD family Fe-S cluster assembly protein [Acholeplasmataceae bacterium]|nr:SufD family Fe-S cluster assembly protein [Acholeplasmataceae bacterium]
MSIPVFLKDDRGTLTVTGKKVVNNTHALHDGESFVFTGTSKEPANIIIKAVKDASTLKITFDQGSYSMIRLIFVGEQTSDCEIKFSLMPKATVNMAQMFFHASKTMGRVALKATVGAQASLRIDDCIVHDGILDLSDHYHLVGEGAKLYHRTLHVASGADRAKRNQMVYHQAQATVSKLDNYLIAAAGAKLKYQVSGVIEKGKKGSACNQSNRGLIFCEQAEIEADPYLFIDEYDVFAAHGAAIGQISEDEMFYLQSRGLSELEAKKLILSGYIVPFIEAVGDAEYGEYINSLIEAKIKGAGIV